MNDEDKYVVLCFEQGVLGIGTKRSYGMDVTAPIDGIEFSLTLEHDEYHIIGEFYPLESE